MNHDNTVHPAVSHGLPRRDALRAGLVAIVAAFVLGWLATHAAILFPDSLRYVEQARRLERGDWHDGIRAAVDHPLYPLAIAAVHRAFGVANSPAGWQAAAQATAVLAAVLLVVPLTLVARALFGPSSAWLGALLVFLAPVPAHVMADGLSESTFLLFWTWGVWATLRFFEAGSLRWLAAALTAGALAFLSRPEGLLLPLALVATLGLSLAVPAARLPRRTWWNAVILIGLGGSVLVGPFVAIKGGVGTKPAIARLLGLAPPSPRDAVERERPLDATRSTPATYALAARATTMALCEAVTLPWLAFAMLGVAARLRRRWSSDRRAWLFLAVVFGGSWIALIRLHATGGYCSARHTLLLALPLFAAAAAGLRVTAAWLQGLLHGSTRFEAWPGRLPVVTALIVVLAGGRALLAPVNAGYGGYREAGTWIARHVEPGARVVDPTGWALFYGERPGYVFANLGATAGDPEVRWVVAREAHLKGPWGYCELLRGLVAGARVAARFPADDRAGVSRVTIFERPLPTRTLAVRR